MLFLKRINRTKKDKKKSMRVRFVSRSYISFLTVTIIPMMVLGAFYKKNFKGHIHNELLKKIQTRRDVGMEDIKKEYRDLQFTLQHFSKTLGKDFIKGYYSKNSKLEAISHEVKEMHVDMEMFKEIDYLENIYIWDWEFKEIYSLNDGGESARGRLENAFFSSQTLVDPFILEGDGWRERLFYKITEGGNVVGYTAFEINGSIFNEFFEGLQKDESAFLLNEEYKVIHASDPLLIGKKVIDNVTKNMLEGLVDTEEHDGGINSYGFIDFKSSSIYLNVHEDIEGKFKVVSDMKIFIVLIFAGAMLFSGVIFYGYLKKVREYSSNYILSSDGFSESYICKEVVRLLDRGENILDNILQKEDEIKELKDRLRGITNEFIDGGSKRFEEKEEKKFGNN